VALTHTRAKEVAEQIKSVCNQAKELSREINDILTFNSNQAIDWGAVSKPAYLNEDAAGNLDGLGFTRAQVSNAVGSLDALKTAFAGGHLGNINQLADADA
jgi:hypothetical protein